MADEAHKESMRRFIEVIIEGAKGAARFVMRGVHRVRFFDVPPSGQSFASQALNFDRPGPLIEERGRPTCSA